jgi:hypothetical protein
MTSSTDLDPTVEPIARFTASEARGCVVPSSLIVLVTIWALGVLLISGLKLALAAAAMVGTLITVWLAISRRGLRECQIRLYEDGIGATSWGGPWDYVSLEDLANVERYFGEGSTPAFLLLVRHDGTSMRVPLYFLTEAQRATLDAHLTPRRRARNPSW